MKKVLIISYKWPPCGGIGVLRNLKFAKYLREFGWEPIVLVPTNADYPYLDNKNLSDIPKDIKVLRVPILEPFGIFKLLSGKSKDYALSNPVDITPKKQNIIDKLGIFIRGNFFIPDARALWIKPATRAALDYLKENKVDAIFTDGPPHTNTRIGYHLSKKTNLPWLADFQDPWSQVDYLQKYMLTPLAWKIHRKMEQQVFRTANKITSASPGFCKQLESIGASDVTTLYYGYDEEDFNHLEKTKQDKFRISHAGLLGADRNPNVLFKILNGLCQESKEFQEDLEILLMGNVDYSVISSLKEQNLFTNTILTGSISREVVLTNITNSSILLLLINKAYNADARIPAKVFEYIRTGNSILALGPKKSDISDLLHSVDLNESIPYQNETEIRNYLLSEYQKYKEDIVSFNLAPSVSSLSNRAITKKLGYLLDSIT